MKKEKLLEIMHENERFGAKLRDALDRANACSVYDWDTKQYRPAKEGEKHCDCTKEAASFKRSAMDMKRILANL